MKPLAWLVLSLLVAPAMEASPSGEEFIIETIPEAQSGPCQHRPQAGCNPDVRPEQTDPGGARRCKLVRPRVLRTNHRQW